MSHLVASLSLLRLYCTIENSIKRLRRSWYVIGTSPRNADPFLPITPKLSASNRDSGSPCRSICWAVQMPYFHQRFKMIKVWKLKWSNNEVTLEYLLWSIGAQPQNYIAVALAIYWKAAVHRSFNHSVILESLLPLHGVAPLNFNEPRCRQSFGPNSIYSTDSPVVPWILGISVKAMWSAVVPLLI